MVASPVSSAARTHVPAARETGEQGFVYLKQLEKKHGQGEEYCFLSLKTPDRQNCKRH